MIFIKKFQNFEFFFHFILFHLIFYVITAAP